jgi:hypothetical protein
VDPFTGPGHDTGDNSGFGRVENRLGKLLQIAGQGIRTFGEPEPVANDEHVALLRQGTATWNEWREQNACIKPDLEGASLKGVELRNANLGETILFEADLREADLSGADLTLAYLRAARLDDAKLSGAFLPGTNLINADLTDADLTGADLTKADLSGAGLLRTNFEGAYLYEVNLTGSRLRKPILTQSKLFMTIFGGIDLSDTIGLEHCVHLGPSVIDFRTLSLSKDLPISFLRGCGLPETLIDYLPSLRGDAIQFYSCFISYSVKDQIFAERLHADLQNKGVRCWFAPHDLPIGAKTWDAIDEAIRLRDKLLLILSKASIDSEWVEDEVNKAYAEERSRKETVLLPIRLDNAVISTDEPWAVKLRDQRNIGDFRQWREPAEYQKSLDRLLRDLKASGVK